MKKIITLVLAIAMTACVSISANAAKITSVEDGSNKSSSAVKAKYIESPDAAECVSVDVEWGSMTFTYTQGEKTWNPTTHKDDIADGEWSEDGNSITVKNHSNIGIIGTLSYTPDSAFSEVNGEFYDSADYDTVFSSFDLEAANMDLCPEDTAYFNINSGKVDSTVGDGTKIGTITLTINSSIDN